MTHCVMLGIRKYKYSYKYRETQKQKKIKMIQVGNDETKLRNITLIGEMVKHYNTKP